MMFYEDIFPLLNEKKYSFFRYQKKVIHKKYNVSFYINRKPHFQNVFFNICMYECMHVCIYA